MASTPDNEALAALLAAARRQAFATFEKEIREGCRDPVAELPEYRRQRRDYRSLLRSGRIPEEAQALAAKLLATQDLSLPRPEAEAFERDVTAMLIGLYEAFIDAAGAQDQGNR